MIIEILISILIGILSGIVTGFIPGFHINLITTFLISLNFSNLNEIDALYSSSFIISLAVSNIFFSFIPTIFWGCPEEETSLSALPGHKMLMKGDGYKALRLTSKGAFIGGIIFLFITPILIFFMHKIYDLIEGVMFFILFAASLFLVFKEKDKKNSLIIFILSGILGYLCFNSKINQPLLPLFTGLFGMPIILTNLKTKVKVQKQKIREPILRLNLKMLAGMILSSVTCGFLPGLGTSQAIALGTIFQKPSSENFLFLSGAVNILILGMSVITLFTINKTRTGSAVALKEIFNGSFTIKELLFLIFIFIFSSSICYFLIRDISKKISIKANCFDYHKISIFLLIFIGSLVLIISNIKGVILLAVSCLLGIYANNFKISRTQMMGCLLIPTMIYYL